MKPQFVLAGILALGGALLGVLSQPNGDPSATIERVEQQIQDVFAPNLASPLGEGKHGAVDYSALAKKFGGDQVITAETLLRRSSRPVAERRMAWEAFYESRDADELAERLGPVAIEKNVKADLWDLKNSHAEYLRSLQGAPPPGFVLDTDVGNPPWEEVGGVWANLAWQNQRIAKAKALLRYSVVPDSWEAPAWAARYEHAKAPWVIEERGTLWGRRFGYALAFGAATFGATVLVLGLIVWAWNFLLARLREVSDAVRGK